MVTRKADLQRIIDDQQSKISKYEQKLRDVIRAYKSLAAEKSALEESVKALNVSESADECQQDNVTGDYRDCEQSASEREDKGNDKIVDDLCERSSVTSSVDTGSEIAPGEMHLKPQDRGSRMTVLRRALATITEEKSKQEKAFTEDRKNLLQEIAKLKEEIQGRDVAAEQSELSFKQQIQELKSNMRHMQCERDCEQTDHVAMLKEVQEKLNHARTQCDIGELQASELSADLKAKGKELFESQQLIEQLLEENGQLKSELDDAKKKVSEMPQIARMHEELIQIKAQHATAIREEQTRTSHSVSELSQSKEEHENRVASLEAKIAELTVTLGDYERLRRRDLEIIDKLTLRVNELDMENTTLAKLSSCQNCVFPPKGETAEVIIDKMKKLCSELRRRQLEQNSGHMYDLYDILGLDSPRSDALHSTCQAEYNSLKEEYDKYKLRAQAALKKRNLIKDTETNDRHEVDQLRKIITDLQISQSDSQRRCADCEATCAELRRSMGHLKEEHKRELTEAENRAKQQISDIEIESSKQRERSMAVLTEKERELETMRAILRAIRSSSPYVTSDIVENESSNRSHQFSTIREGSPNIPTSSRPENLPAAETTTVGRRGSSESLQSNRSVPDRSMDHFDSTSATANAPNIHLAQELARSEKTIDQLRREIRQLENTIRETERALLTKELQNYDTIEKLKEEIRSLESRLWRCQLPGENFEYLKNVLVQYMVCDDAVGKSHMLKAISRVLNFSAKELESIQKHNARVYWWPGGKPK